MAVKKISDRDFKTSIREKGMTVVDFGAAWCAPCKTLLPILEKLDQEMGESVSILNTPNRVCPISPAGKD